MGMRKNRLGSTDLKLSAVGFGTCQLQMVPEAQAVATLVRGFELGVNWVHADLGYGGVETLVARAIAQSGRKDVIPVANGWGSTARMEEAFQHTCRAYGKDRLELFGLSCIDDDDLILKHDVWGKHGMVARLQQMRREGRIGATWCSTHGEPAYVERLIESGAFDAIMLAYNPLGFHALTYDAKQEGKEYEDVAENARRIFPLALARKVGLLIMKPLAGGLLVPSKAFPQRKRFSREAEPLTARDILRSILVMPGVTAVVPGTASVEEAEENARAGHEPIEVAPRVTRGLTDTVTQMRTELCSRCGECEPTCSKQLPISWMFREGYVWSYTADVFDAIDRHHYFHLHPSTTLACHTCTNRSCECPYGISIPDALTDVHAQVLDMRDKGVMHPPPAEADAHTRRGHVAARVLLVDVPKDLAPGANGTCRLWLENAGQQPWRPATGADGGTPLYLRAMAGDYPLAECALRITVAAGERAFFAFDMRAPMHAGTLAVEYQLVTPGHDDRPERATAVAERPLAVGAAPAPSAPAETYPCGTPKARPVPVAVELPAADRDTAVWKQLHALHPWSYTPTQGMAMGPGGASFPLIVDRAEGCRIWDLRGREYLDYTMAWGTTVLGYGNPHVQQALAAAMRAPPLLAYPRSIQAEVVTMLAEDFPGVTKVAFGKNGSDVCTLAARLCRSYTGRKTILYCGYHGWGDFWVEQHGFGRTGVPEHDPHLIHRFRFNDTAGFLQLFERHRSDLAGVMLEPSGPWGGNEVGQEPDVEQAFLETLRKATRSVGALLIFDEIITGYRYLQGSVQKARGVIPDLTCLGKALASGMPLSALLGRGDVMEVAFGKTHYGPTFQAEAWSLAAAKATIEVFRREPVAEHVWRQGEALRVGVEAALRDAGLAGAMKGPPFRMSLVLGEADVARRHRQRTLLQQELLQRGISIYDNGVMLPCFAHDDDTLARTLAAFRDALALVATATADGSLERRLVIPLLREM